MADTGLNPGRDSALSIDGHGVWKGPPSGLESANRSLAEACWFTNCLSPCLIAGARKARGVPEQVNFNT